MFYIRSVWWITSAENNNKEARSMIDGVMPSGQGLAASFGVAGAGGEADAAPSLNLDTHAYLPMLADYELTDEQAREMLTALWSIMRGFVELGISVDVCGELGFDAVPVLSNDPASLDSNNQHQEKGSR